MTGLVKGLLALLGIGAVGTALYVASGSGKKYKYRVKYLVNMGPMEAGESYETREAANEGFKKHIKSDSYVSLEERIKDTNEWKSLGYNKGKGKSLK